MKVPARAGTLLARKLANASLNRDHILARRLELFHPIDYLSGKRIQRLRMLGIFSRQRDRIPCIPAFADLGIQFDRTQERHTELLRRSLAATLREDVDLLMAMRAMERPHVFGN